MKQIRKEYYPSKKHTMKELKNKEGNIGEFLSEISVAGYTIIDIMVFQIDRFKAFLDRDTNNTKYNECHMILLAFDTFMKMKKNPEKYIEEMSSISGSDYDGKF